MAAKQKGMAAKKREMAAKKRAISVKSKGRTRKIIPKRALKRSAAREARQSSGPRRLRSEEEEADIPAPPVEAKDAVSELNTLPAVSVWQLEEFATMYEWEESDFSRPGYLLIEKLEELTLPISNIQQLDPRCIASTEKEEVVVNLSICPAVDLMIDIVNSISSRVVVNPSGEILYDIGSTDILGTRDSMTMEAMVLDALSFLKTISVETNMTERTFSLHGLYEDVTFKEIPDCNTYVCFGLKTMEKQDSYWTLEIVRYGLGDQAKIEDVSSHDFGLWLEETECNNGTADFSLLTSWADEGVGKRSYVSVDMVTGKIKSSDTVAAFEAENELAAQLNQLIQRMEYVVFYLISLPRTLALVMENVPDGMMTESTVTAAIFRVSSRTPQAFECDDCDVREGGVEERLKKSSGEASVLME